MDRIDTKIARLAMTITHVEQAARAVWILAGQEHDDAMCSTLRASAKQLDITFSLLCERLRLVVQADAQKKE